MECHSTYYAVESKKKKQLLFYRLVELGFFNLLILLKEKNKLKSNVNIKHSSYAFPKSLRISGHWYQESKEK